MLRNYLSLLIMARITAPRVLWCIVLVIAGCSTPVRPLVPNSPESKISAVLWHPGLSIERIDSVAPTANERVGPEQTRIEQGIRRIHCVRGIYQSYSGTTTQIQMHGQADFVAGKIYYVHQNLSRGRLEIIQLTDDFVLPREKIILYDPAYDKAIRTAERIRRSRLFPGTFQSTDEAK